jgi:hypothetical protein
MRPSSHPLSCFFHLIEQLVEVGNLLLLRPRPSREVLIQLLHVHNQLVIVDPLAAFLEVFNTRYRLRQPTCRSGFTTLCLLVRLHYLKTASLRPILLERTHQRTTVGIRFFDP